MTNKTRDRFVKLVQQLESDCMRNFKEDEFPHYWITGFLNMLAYGHTDSDDDNSFCKEEEPHYSTYKAGAKAAMILLECKYYEPTDS